MVRKFWIPATALCLAVVMAVIGSLPREALAAAGVQSGPLGDLSGRYWTRGIVLLIIIVLLIWLIYRSFTGWRPMIS
jgi:uncharacterized membrane protein